MIGTPRSANIDSINYCTLAHLSNVYFNKLCDICPELITSIKERALSTYADDWIQFKSMLLQQVDYFQGINDNPNCKHFLKEIQFHMEETIYQPGTEIIQVG